jgi:hypothetical protein
VFKLGYGRCIIDNFAFAEKILVHIVMLLPFIGTSLDRYKSSVGFVSMDSRIIVLKSLVSAISSKSRIRCISICLFFFRFYSDSTLQDYSVLLYLLINLTCYSRVSIEFYCGDCIHRRSFQLSQQSSPLSIIPSGSGFDPVRAIVETGWYVFSTTE